MEEFGAFILLAVFFAIICFSLFNIFYVTDDKLNPDYIRFNNSATKAVFILEEEEIVIDNPRIQVQLDEKSFVVINNIGTAYRLYDAEITSSGIVD